MQKTIIFVFCLILVALLQSPAWSQTKNGENGEKEEDTWQGSAKEMAPRVFARYGKIITFFADRYGIPSHWLGGVILVESSGKLHTKGGLTQVSEEVKRETGITCDTRDPICAIEVAAAYLAKIQRRHGLDAPRVMVAYNVGPSRVRRIRNPREQTYFRRFICAVLAYDNAAMNH